MTNISKYIRKFDDRLRSFPNKRLREFIDSNRSLLHVFAQKPLQINHTIHVIIHHERTICDTRY